MVQNAAGVWVPTSGPDANRTLVKQYNKPFTYPPNSLVNNEIGWKTEWSDHRLQFNGSAYIMDWKDVQTLIYNPPIFGNTTFGVQGPDYRIKGFELQFEGVTVPTTTWLRYDQPAYTTYDASLGIAKDQWHVEAFGTNLSNSDASLFTSSAQFIESQVPLRPRVLGVKFGWKF